MCLIEKFLMISSDLFFKIYTWLLDINMCSTAIEFTVLTVALVFDLLQLPPVIGKPINATAHGFDTPEIHLALYLWLCIYGLCSNFLN